MIDNPMVIIRLSVRFMGSNAAFNNISAICADQFYWWMKREYRVVSGAELLSFPEHLRSPPVFSEVHVF
jgi:hypothetical protein